MTSNHLAKYSGMLYPLQDRNHDKRLFMSINTNMADVYFLKEDIFHFNNSTNWHSL